MSESSNHQDFVETLDSFRELKTGISGSRIKKLTTYALEHVDAEDVLISQIINYSRTCEDSHKLGSLYIIDSIGRAYLDEARTENQQVKDTAPVGTAAHAVYTLGQVIQELLVDAVEKSNQDHKEKIRLLMDIWDRSALFQKGDLNSVRGRFFSMGTDSPAKLDHEGGLPSDASTRADYILQNLKAVPVVPNVKIPQNLFASDELAQKAALYDLLSNIQRQYNTDPNLQIDPPEKPVKTAEPQRQQRHVVTEYGSRRDREREREKGGRRTRSRSPRRDTLNQAPAISRFQNTPPTNTSTYNMGKPNTNFGINNHHLYPDEKNVPQNPHYRPKMVSYDPSVPPDHIKVFSRTLFLGGVPMNMKEWDLANVLRPYAEVQSVILNNARKHAFVKVYSRQEAENALLNFNKDGSLPLRTRWGVGFGPRDCCDYQHGFSIIPVQRLTDADKKWSLGAQWGGTGGQPLTNGITFEEPDIIVGEGVSSKAISQKMPTDSGRNGPRSNKAKNAPPQFGPPQGAVISPNAGYANMQYPPAPQPMGNYGQPMMPQQPMGTYPPPQQQMGVPHPPPHQHQQQQQQHQHQQQPPQSSNFDPTAQLNSLMNILNQQQK
ncbi:Protein NRD1 [Nakaseomyces bracarensis]|uniref:Protein NRD1 n=1 Tax=Nakaseomyces bracarensis TaxID=273131 RepID=A0ABR4NYK1_9SACH